MSEEQTLKPQILVVDDSKVVRRAAAKMLGDDYQIHEAVDGMDAWRQLQRNDAISVVFSDMQMPEMDGLELLANIRNSADERLAALPVIMITGVGDTENAKRDVFEAGATDFIAKPFESIDLISRARSYARLNRRLTDLAKKSSHDQFTGLFSAVGFEEQGEKALSFAIRHRLQLSVVYFEIIGFQEIYLANGKNRAQQILGSVGKRLKQIMRAEDVAARVGVARFAVLLPMTSHVNARVVIERIHENIGQLLFNTGKEKIGISLAAGFTSADIHDRQKFAEIMEQADAALHKALELNAEEKIACFHDNGDEAGHKSLIAGDDIRKAFEQILNGEYAQVPDHVLQPIADKLTPFLDYVASRSDTGRTGTDNS